MRVREKLGIFDYQSGNSQGILIHVLGMSHESPFRQQTGLEPSRFIGKFGLCAPPATLFSFPPESADK